MCPYDPSNKAWQLDKFASAMHEEERKPNPVVQRVKVIMALGLIVVQLHSRYLAGMTGLSFGFSSQAAEKNDSQSGVTEDEIEKIPLADYIWWKTLNISVDQVSRNYMADLYVSAWLSRGLSLSLTTSLLSSTSQLITIVLATVLFVKYIFFDKSETYASSPSPLHGSSESFILNSNSGCPFSQLKMSEASVPNASLCTHIPSGFTNGHIGNGHLRPWEQQAVSVNRNVLSLDQPALPSVEGDVRCPETSVHSTSLSAEKPEIEKESLLTTTEKPPIPTISVSSQTDSQELHIPPTSKAAFTVGPSSEDSTSESEGEGERPHAQEPRPLEECLSIFKSEVSGLMFLQELRMCTGIDVANWTKGALLGIYNRGDLYLFSSFRVEQRCSQMRRSFSW